MVTTLLQPAAAVLDGFLAPRLRVLVRDRRIAELGTEDFAADRREALAGILLPGFVDLQVNGAGGHGCDEADPKALDAISAHVLAGGATAFLPTLITAPFEQLLRQVEAVARWIERGRHAATPLGIHCEGPFLQTAGAHDGRCFVDPTPERIDALLTAARGRLRLVTLAPGRAHAAEAVARLRQAGVTVALGHFDATAGLEACVGAGARLVTHLFNAMGRLHHRVPGPTELALDEPRLSCSLIADGTHVHPAWVRLAWRSLGPDRLVLVTDSVAAAGMPDGPYQLAGRPVTLRGGVVTGDDGVLAGSALTFAQAAGNFLRFVPEVGPWTLARIAAKNPARLIGETGRGSIARGAAAEFVEWRPDGSLRAFQVG